jgi:hypothetical protein
MLSSTTPLDSRRVTPTVHYLLYMFSLATPLDSRRVTPTVLGE